MRTAPWVRRRLLRLGLPILLVAGLLASCGDLLGDLANYEPLNWNGRLLYEENLDWASNRDMSLPSFESRVALYTSRGMMIVDVDVRPEGLGRAYSLVAHENVDSRDWELRYDLTPSQFASLAQTFDAQGYRLLDIESYLIDGQQRFAAIWIENVEDLDWTFTYDKTSSEYNAFFNTQSAAGLRPIDIEGYRVGGTIYFAAIWVDNVDGLQWSQRRNRDRTEYQADADSLSAAGYQMIDYESHPGSSGTLYAAIWERPVDRPGSAIRTNRTQTGFANLWRTYRDQGMRLADFENYDVSNASRYGGIWIENDDRYRYALRSSLDSAVQTYWNGYQGDNGGVDTGLSVAIIQDGQLIYTHGIGNADDAAGEVAHSETVYGYASVSKVIGGTLATLMEDATTLRDGTSVALDMNDPTADYLTGIDGSDLPDHHDHTVEQLTAHLGCVPHYTTTPGIPNQTTHYDDALDAVRSIWDTLLVTSCTIGTTRSYSTPAFTFLGAVLEQSVGTPHTIAELLEEEIFDPFGLSSMRVQFRDGSQVADYERAVLYTRLGAVQSHRNNTWKVLGGGIEGDAVDLARFGWRVLDGQIVDPAVRDARLWATVDDTCTTTGTGTCENGVGWEIRSIGSSPTRRIAEHGGYQTGARSHLRVYRDDGLVVAILSNEAGPDNAEHNPGTLVTTLANLILAP